MLSYVESAIAEGAQVECGGRRVEVGGNHQGGWFLAPTILTSCTDQMKVNVLEETDECKKLEPIWFWAATASSVFLE